MKQIFTNGSQRVKMFKRTKPIKLRNLLESPFQICWPEKSKEELLPVQNALMELLPAARLEENSIQTNISEKRKAKEKSYTKMKQKNIYRDFLAPGYQSVIRGMEKKELCCAVFSNDVAPSLLLKVALTCAQTSSTPAIVIPDLKTITTSALGFAAMALGFKTVVAEFKNNPFHKIFKMICENPTIIELPLTIKPYESSFLKLKITDEVVEKHKSFEMDQVNTERMYLFRKPKGIRVFVPNCNVKKLHHDSPKTKIPNPLDFISLEDSIQGKRSSHKLESKTVVKESYSCDDDDTDSNDGNIFFVDNLPDETLLQTNYDTRPQETNLKFKKKANRVMKNTQDSSKNGPRPKHFSAHKNTSCTEGLNKYCKKKNVKPNQASSVAVKFQPLSIKTVTCKLNKTKVKAKKRLKVKSY